MKQLVNEFLAVGVSSFLVTAILCHYIIPALQKKHIGQSIREEGPRSHRKKAGTPTMGGICFIVGILIALLGMTVYYAARGKQGQLIPLALGVSLALGNGLIGLYDDCKKLAKKKNEGLKAGQKFALQGLCAALYLAVMSYAGYIDTALHIPFTDIMLEMGALYYIGAWFFIVGVVNSVNLTDGIDGLATSVTIVFVAFAAFVGLNLLNSSQTLLAGALIGGLLAFLRKNYHVAEVFMGDTGSLFLGGVVAGVAFMLGDMLVVMIAGGIYIIEALSVIIQVGVFRLTSKRVFRMAPIHHHFEAYGWSENKIVIVFSLVTLLLCTISYFAL